MSQVPGLLLFLCAACLQPGPATQDPAAALVLSHEGASDYRIVEPNAPSDVERRAVGELQDYLDRVTGARLPVVSEADAPAAHRILVGNTRAAAGIERAALGTDGFTIRTAGTDLLLVGGNGRGTLYAVYELLENLGCRMWAPGVVHVPEKSTLLLPPIDDTQVPEVEWRYVHYSHTRDAAYRDWHKVDRIQAEIGRSWAPRWVHSMMDYVPAERYFDEHPEYFALVGGERRPTQLCLTHPDVLEITIAGIREVLAEHPEVRYISISQEDNYEHCQCEDARRINEREGSAMGEVLTFVNAVAEQFPDRIISTLAYQYSRTPPRHLRPRPNVSVMLCSIEEDRSRPIADSPDSRFAAELDGWAAICDDVFLWDYEIQFSNMVSPFPNLRVLQPNVRLFVDRGVRHLFLQGGWLESEWSALRCYLLAKLAWNADADVDALIDDFLAGYYGAAAGPLRQYVNLMHDALEQSGDALLIYGAPWRAENGYLRPEMIERYRQCFDRAEREVAGDRELAERVRRARLPLMYARLELVRRRGLDPAGVWRRRADGGLEPRPELVALLRSFVEGVEAAGLERLHEHGLSPEEYRRSYERLFDPGALVHSAFGCEIRAVPEPSSQYPAGGVVGLVNGLPGGLRYDESWVGWEGTDVTLTLDLGEVREVQSLRLGAFQDARSWIFLPQQLRVSVSTDGGAFTEVAILEHEISDRANELVHEFRTRLDLRARYLRIEVDATETCPAWHLGAGGPSWVFFDELAVESQPASPL